MKRIYFKDEGQDLLYADADQFGIIRRVSNFCSSVVRRIYQGAVVKDIAQGREINPTQPLVLIDPKNEYRMWECIYNVERIEEVEDSINE